MRYKPRLIMALICVIAVMIPCLAFADTGSLKYTGQAADQQTITADDVELDSEKYEFDGTAKEATVTIANLTKDQDYTVEFANNIYPGTATVTINGMGDWEGTITKEYQIVQKVEGALTRIAKYDCVYFGSYPQIEIVDVASRCGVEVESTTKEGDYIVDADLYAALTGASFDAKGDTTIDGKRYHRIKQSDATDSSYIGAYTWPDAETYHYFRYDPIKWRILKRDGNDAYLMADISLDTQKYHSSWMEVTWEDCTLRDWLNQEFLDRAFNSAEQRAINPIRSEDQEWQYKVSIPSWYDVRSIDYGFDEDENSEDPARLGLSSTYAKAMGGTAYTGGYNLWWLGTEAAYDQEPYVSSLGKLDRDRVIDTHIGVRPALHLDLRSTSVYEEAGSISLNKSNTVESANMFQTQYPYLGEPITPDVFIYPLVEGTDYTLSYSNNDKIGVATVTITGINRYSGSMTLNYAIVDKADISGMEAHIVTSTYYSGKPVEPKILIEGLNEDTDFSLAYENNDGVGTGTVIITGNPEYGYTGQITLDFNIEQATDISNMTATLSQTSYQCDGWEKYPQVTIDGLEEGSDFHVTYENNVFGETAQAIVEGKDAYCGSITLEFTIHNPMYAVIDRIAALPAASAVNLSHKAQIVAARAAYNKLRWELQEEVDTTKLSAAEAKIKKLEQVAFAKRATSISKVKSPKKKTIQVTWKTVSGVAAYQVQYSLKKNYKSAKIATFKKAATKTGKIKKIKSRKTYYVRVRMYKSIGGKTIYSKWSGSKKIKVK